MKVKQRLRLVSTEGGLHSSSTGASWQKKRQDKAADESCRDDIASLYRDYNDVLVRYLTIRLRSQQDAIEVAQEAYIRLIRRKNLQDIDCFQSFLFRTATNISIDLQRRRARQARNLANNKFLLGDIDEITPERALNARQTMIELRKALEELPPKCREAFMLYKFNNLGHAEIADQMGLSVSSIRKYIARGLTFCIQRINP
ncbi:MAG: sigma-70 family RNA polymerase sigma factor [Emcibacter sp.]|nr:sigma-70 family RNA polymerase sigma factor [Emcibacter sp.]